MTGIAPGAYVRVVSGMYRGTEGRVTRIDDGANGPYATVDVGGTMWPTIAVYVSALELVGAVPTLRDRVTVVLEAARAQRDREAELAETRGEEACCHEYAHALMEETIAALTQALEEGS